MPPGTPRAASAPRGRSSTGAGVDPVGHADDDRPRSRRRSARRARSPGGSGSAPAARPSVGRRSRRGRRARPSRSSRPRIVRSDFRRLSGFSPASQAGEGRVGLVLLAEPPHRHASSASPSPRRRRDGPPARSACRSAATTAALGLVGNSVERTMTGVTAGVRRPPASRPRRPACPGRLPGRPCCRRRPASRSTDVVRRHGARRRSIVPSASASNRWPVVDLVRARRDRPGQERRQLVVVRRGPAAGRRCGRRSRAARGGSASDAGPDAIVPGRRSIVADDPARGDAPLAELAAPVEDVAGRQVRPARAAARAGIGKVGSASSIATPCGFVEGSEPLARSSSDDLGRPRAWPTAGSASGRSRSGRRAGVARCSLSVS